MNRKGVGLTDSHQKSAESGGGHLQRRELNNLPVLSERPMRLTYVKKTTEKEKVNSSK